MSTVPNCGLDLGKTFDVMPNFADVSSASAAICAVTKLAVNAKIKIIIFCFIGHEILKNEIKSNNLFGTVFLGLFGVFETYFCTFLKSTFQIIFLLPYPLPVGFAQNRG
jgi:hypothetical protein